MKAMPIRRALLVVCSLLLPLASPSIGRAAIRPGVELGLNVSSFSYDDDSGFPFTYWDRHWSKSFTGGVTLEVPFRPRFAVVTGLRYVEQGLGVKAFVPGSPPFTTEFRFVQRYVSVPVLLSSRPLPSRRFFLTLGPEMGLLVSGRSITDRSSLGPPRNDDIKKSLEDYNLSLDVGAGFESPMGKHVGVVGLRYTHGLIGVARKDQWASGWKTRGLEVLVGMRR